MISVYFQVAGLLLTVMIAILFVSKTKLLFDTDRAFLCLLMNIVLAITTDIIAEYAMAFYDYDMLQVHVAVGICKLFLMVQMCVGGFTMRYAFVAIRGEGQIKRIVRQIYGYVMLVACLGVLLTPARIVTQYTGTNYVAGISPMLAYSVLLLYFVCCVVMIVRNRRSMQASYYISALTFAGMISVAVVLANFRQDLNLISFAMALALLFMYLEMENPDDYVDGASGALNDYAFQRWEQRLMDGHEYVMLFLITIAEAEYLKKKMGMGAYEAMLGAFVQSASHIHGAKLFRLDSGEFVLIERDMEQKDYVEQELYDIYQSVAKQYTSLKPEFVKLGLIPTTQGYENMMTLNADMRFFYKHMQSLPGGVLHVMNEEALKLKNQEDYVVLSLKKAIEKNEIMVYYQPIYSTAKQRYTTAEALIRIRDLDGRFMSPELFIPIAEQRGFILTLGHAVFENVCRFVKEQDLEKRGFDYLEINLSTVQCMQKGLATELVSIMKEYSISPGFINLEITETAAIQSEKTLLVNMQRLIQLGVSFSLDDYGSGYSNLDYVIRMPFYLVKLDKLLVWSSFENAKTRVLLESSVNMFQKMHLRIVAEGVETKAQALYLDHLGVDYLQGYYFSKPISEEEFAVVISNNTKRNLYREAEA